MPAVVVGRPEDERGLVLAHAALITAGYALQDAVGPIAELRTLLGDYPWMLPAAGGLVLLLHVASMMAVMAVVAVVVYEKLGVAIVRQAWLNTEWLWASAFVLAGIVTLFS